MEQTLLLLKGEGEGTRSFPGMACRDSLIQGARKGTFHSDQLLEQPPPPHPTAIGQWMAAWPVVGGR